MAQLSWLFLLLAGLFELGFTTIMKLSDGFSLQRPGYVIAFCLCALASFGMINLAIKGIPLGTAYAIWTGIGVFGTVIIGIVWFGDPTTPSRLVFLSLLLVSIIGLKLVE